VRTCAARGLLRDRQGTKPPVRGGPARRHGEYEQEPQWLRNGHFAIYKRKIPVRQLAARKEAPRPKKPPVRGGPARRHGEDEQEPQWLRSRHFAFNKRKLPVRQLAARKEAPRPKNAIPRRSAPVRTKTHGARDKGKNKTSCRAAMAAPRRNKRPKGARKDTEPPLGAT